jgi:bifunctional UDP-N-acetylglucosamine pyrophosphorylase/glucosamine-1-phosphate N-acetyltransferase
MSANKIGLQQRDLAAIILAAGKSTRMKSDRAKVLHEICGRPMIGYVIDACRGAGIKTFYVVIGFGKGEVAAALADEPGVHLVEQAEQKGTGHAVMQCAGPLKSLQGDVVVIAGDMPLIRSGTLRDLIAAHRSAGAAASLATTVLEDPTGYGRIIRNAKGEFERIVEHRDGRPDQLAIREVNPSYYCFDAALLAAALPKLTCNNAKGEYYITDLFDILRREGRAVHAATGVPAEDATGINSRSDLAHVGKLLQRRIAGEWMELGVTIVDPETTWIDCRARIGSETVIRPFSFIEGDAQIGSDCLVGPYAYVRSGAVVADRSVIGPGALSALDTSGGERQVATTTRKHVQVVRRPPAPTGMGSRVS